ncbi:MAG: hypothetical protein RLZ35_1193 [Pseudomonadota bacterium]|jgi:tellurite resistance protein TerC
MEKPIYVWIVFISIVFTLLAIDLGIFNKRDHVIKFKESLWLSAFYIFIGSLFSLWIWYIKGFNGFSEYITGFLVEKSLSLDNIFVISLIFSHLSIPEKYQHRVLFFGILGVIVLRAIMIGLGATILHEFFWVLYIFGGIMVFTGVKMLFITHQSIKISKNFILIWMKKHLKITDKLHKQKFYLYQTDPKSQKKKLFFTPLFLALIMVEFTDLVFAIDSIPAIFAITQDTYIVYTSNIFAVLGLRALYFALASMVEKFYYLKYALAVILIFIGSKIFIADAFGLTKIPPILSLSVTVIILFSGVLASFLKQKKNFNRKGN